MADNFIYARRDLIVLAVAFGIVVFFLGLGFGLGNAAPTTKEDWAAIAPEDTYQRALRVLSQNPIFDGLVTWYSASQRNDPSNILSQLHVYVLKTCSLFPTVTMICRGVFGVTSEARP